MSKGDNPIDISEMLSEWKKARRAETLVGADIRNRHGIKLKQKKLKRKASPYRGVSWNSRGYGWVVRMKIAGKSTNLGFFCAGREIEAAKAYDMAAIRHFGSEAILNFPKDSRNEFNRIAFNLPDRPPTDRPEQP
jgi:hypothetical protein